MFKGKGKVKLSYKKKPTSEQVEKARQQKKVASQKRLDDLTEKIVTIIYKIQKKCISVLQ